MDVPHNVGTVGTQEGELAIQPLKLWENWFTVGQMFRNYPTGLDVAWDAEVRGTLRRIYKRFIDIPLYMAFKNEGYALRIGRQSLGLLYLQHPQLVTHINDIEINAPYRGRGYSLVLLDFAEERAHQLNKKFMTLAVTLSNKRAFNIYKYKGYQEQHNRFYQLNRRWWSEPQPAPALLSTPITTQSYQIEATRRVSLSQLSRTEANANIWRFFKLETQVTNPEVSMVWTRHYPPELPQPAKGHSYGITLGLRGSDAQTFCGHADLFEYGDWLRWRLFLDPALWEKTDLKALLEMLISQAASINSVAIAFGSGELHERVKTIATELGLQERQSERTLMIKLL